MYFLFRFEIVIAILIYSYLGYAPLVINQIKCNENCGCAPIPLLLYFRDPEANGVDVSVTILVNLKETL